jgi:hypothetical protein
MDRWHLPGGGKDLPLRAVVQAVNEILNRDQGRAFLLPSLSRACRSDLSLDRVNKNLTISLIQEGTDSGIFKVKTEVHPAGYHPMNVAFCLNVSRHPRLNDLHESIFSNLKRLWEINSKYVAEPFCQGRAVLRGKRELVVFSTKWLEGYTEVNMFNWAEALGAGPVRNGFEPLGLRGLRLNAPFETGFYEGIIREPLADEIASEMVKILTLYFDPRTEEAIGDYGINSGDFVYRADPDGGFTLKLVTCRQIIKFPASPSSKEHVRAFLFLDDLFRHSENSVHHQEWADPGEWRRYTIFTFTPNDVCRGVKKALVEKYGAEKALPMVLNWLAAYVAMEGEVQKVQPLETKESIFRQHLIMREIEKFLRAEGYPLGRIVVEI